MDNIFFVISKIVDISLSPIFIYFVLFFLILFLKLKKKLKNVHLIVFILIFYFFSNLFIAEEFIRLIEAKPIKKEELKEKYDYIIILGGPLSYYDKEYDQVGFNPCVDRVFQAVKFYLQGKSDYILYCGGDGTLTQNLGKESYIMKKYLIDLGLPAENIIVEDKSRNTYENVKYALEIILKNNKNPKLLVITSAYHVKRVLLCFKKFNIECDYYPVDRMTGKKKKYDLFSLMPTSTAIWYWEIFLHELFGLISYKIMGYI